MFDRKSNLFFIFERSVFNIPNNFKTNQEKGKKVYTTLVCIRYQVDHYYGY